MTQDRLNYLVILSIENDLVKKTDVESNMKKVANLEARKMF